MKFFIFRLLLFVFFFSTIVLPQQHSAKITFINANIVNGYQKEPIENAMVVVSGRKIERIETKTSDPPKNSIIIDVQGRYLLPGLIDSHAHLGSLSDARRALKSGITTVRSASVNSFKDIVLREMVQKGILAGPDILASSIFIQPDLGEAILSDGELITLHKGVNSPEELRRLVRIVLDHGVDWIKTRANERAGILDQDPRRLVYTREQLQIIVEEAAKRGVPVMCHAHSEEGVRAAVEAGVQSIEHGTFVSENTLALMKEKGIFLVPTYSEMFDLTQPFGEYNHPVLQIRGLHMAPRVARNIQRAHKMGVRLVAGGDTGYESHEIARIGIELNEFVRLGLSPLEALQSATTLSAQVLGLSNKTGTIQEGLEADLIVVGENPLENIWALHDILFVMSNGQIALNHLHP